MKTVYAQRQQAKAAAVQAGALFVAREGIVATKLSTFLVTIGWAVSAVITIAGILTPWAFSKEPS